MALANCSYAVKVLDWDKHELDAVHAQSLPGNYTIRSSKYPRTLRNPRRITVVINDTHSYSIHAELLKAFSKKCATLLKQQPTLQTILFTGREPVTSIPAWDIFTTWLYTLDKEPLPDYTPLRLPSWRTWDIKSACFLASFLGAVKFEKYLLRIIFKEVHEGRFAERHLAHLSRCMGSQTGMWHFSNAYFRWKGAGEPGELDPYRWRVEHWYSICGTVANWGCFHAMNTSGWGGVWERQEAMWREVGGVDRAVWRDTMLEEDEWMDEVLYDDLGPVEDDWGQEASEDEDEDEEWGRNNRFGGVSGGHDFGIGQLALRGLVDDSIGLIEDNKEYAYPR